LSAPPQRAHPGSRILRRFARLWRVLARVARHPRYACSVALAALREPGLLAAARRQGWRAALHARCAALCPVAADLVSPYEAGFFGQVFLFDEYEVGRLPLPPAPVVIDVGANVGFFSWRVTAARPRAQVLAFEPQSDNLARLRRMLEAVGARAEACGKACGARAGVAALHLRNSVTHSLDADWHPDLDSGAGAEQVEVTTVDAECARRGLDAVDLLKIDAEGAEAQVLAGAAQTLRRTRFVVLEYHSPRHRQECLAILRAAGFRCREKAFWGAGAARGEEGLLLCARRAQAAGAQPARAVAGA
jgi:FkbM family methyltransferase